MGTYIVVILDNTENYVNITESFNDSISAKEYYDAQLANNFTSDYTVTSIESNIYLVEEEFVTSLTSAQQNGINAIFPGATRYSIMFTI